MKSDSYLRVVIAIKQKKSLTVELQ